MTGKTEKSASEKISVPEVGTTNKPGTFAVLMYQQFISHVTRPGIRRGQAWMNALNDVSPETYKLLTGTDADCFYDDRKIETFRRYVFGTE